MSLSVSSLPFFCLNQLVLFNCKVRTRQTIIADYKAQITSSVFARLIDYDACTLIDHKDMLRAGSPKVKTYFLAATQVRMRESRPLDSLVGEIIKLTFRLDG